LTIFNTLLSSKLRRWFCETPFIPTVERERGKEEEKRVVENFEEPIGAKDSRSLIEAWARIIAHW